MKKYFSFLSSDSSDAYFLIFDPEDLAKITDIVCEMNKCNVELSYLDLDMYSDREEEIASKIEKCKGVIIFLSKNTLSSTSSDLRVQYEIATEYYHKPVCHVILDTIKDNEVSKELFGWWVELKNKDCIYQPNAFKIMHSIGFDIDLNRMENSQSLPENDLLDRFYQYYGEENYKQAATVAKQLSEMGNALGQNWLGVLYEKGFGVKQDISMAIKYYEMAAKQDLTVAFNNLGACYTNYDECRDYAKAFYYNKLAADRGFALSQCNLAKCYLTGNGAMQNYSKAVKYLKLSADQGIADAQFLLGVCYHDGLGVWKNKKKAASLICSAANQGIEEAQLLYGRMCYSGDGVKEDESSAFRYFSMAAEQGNADATAYLGICYENGTGVAQNSNKALELLHKAVDEGSAFGQYFLAGCLLSENCTDADFDEAVRLLRLSAQQDWDLQADAVKTLKQLGVY